MFASRRVAALVATLALGLAACGETADTTAPADPTPSDTTAPADEAPDPTPTTPPAEPSPATTDEATSEPQPAEPQPAEPVSAEADCSAPAVDLPTPTFADLPTSTQDMALFLLDAVRRCDEQLLVTAATESDTRLTFGEADPTTYLTLPEREDEPIYEIMARLIAGTTPALSAGGDVWVWPAVTTGEGTDEDWQSLVTAGLYTQDEVDRLQAAGEGYLGWRLGIDVDGSWTFLVVGD